MSENDRTMGPTDDDPGGSPAVSDRDKLIHSEQVKLTAALVNGVALAFIVGGGVATVIGVGVAAGSTAQLLRASAWIATGIILHFGARLYLRTLR